MGTFLLNMSTKLSSSFLQYYPDYQCLSAISFKLLGYLVRHFVLISEKIKCLQPLISVLIDKECFKEYLLLVKIKSVHETYLKQVSLFILSVRFFSFRNDS